MKKKQNGGSINKKTKLIRIWQLTVIILLNLLIISLAVMQPISEVLSKYGYRGAEVVQIQKKLKNLGYYNGDTDGVYGTGTKNAVVRFQRDRGLTADGIVGANTLRALGLSGAASYSSSD